MRRNPAGKSSSKKQKHAPLLHQIDPSVPLEQYKKGKTTRDEVRDDLTELKEGQVKGRMSKKVMEAIKQQRLEVDREEIDGLNDLNNEEAAELSRQKLSEITPEALLSGHYGDTDDENEITPNNRLNIDSDHEDHDDNDTSMFQHDEQGLELGADDRALLEQFLPSSIHTSKNMIASILEQAEQREATLSLGIKQAEKEGGVELKPGVPREVIVTYQKIGTFLSKFRSGKLPKAFKVIPALRNWEEIMYYTNPAGWSPQATHAAVRLFSHQLKPKHAQRFYSLVLAPKVSAQLAEDGRLGFHLYDSLKQAIYKPSAFFKGLVLPVAAGFPASAFPGQQAAPISKEVIIYASILTRIHLPPVHAAVTLLQMSKIVPFNPYNVLLMKVIIDKKYALPVPVIEGVLAYFYETSHDAEGLVPTVNPRTGVSTDTLPLLWHKCLLHFVQRYKAAFSDEMVAMARAILKKRPHHAVTDEIRRELAVAGSQGSVVQMQQVIDTDMFDGMGM